MNNINKEKVFEKLGKYVNVCNLPSQYIDTKPTLNVFVVMFENGTLYQEGDNVVGADINGTLYLSDHHKDHNAYCKRWCNLNASERTKGLENGTIFHII